MAEGMWLLGDGDNYIAAGTEAEVKAQAQAMLAGKSVNAEASLRESLFLVKPDGSYQGQAEGDGFFTPGEPIEWIDVDW
jgi:hypothetical protein